jgi:succinate dehydrogenase / fumarate reductase cytochrome b subunit
MPAMSEVRDELMVARATDGRLVRRPLSPHLQVYRPQITSVLSVMHRFTGIALSAGMLLYVAWLVGAAHSAAGYDAVAGFIGSWIGLVLMFGWTASLFFHLRNGIRHLAWDAGYGYDLPRVHSGGWAVVIGTAALTVLTWLIAWTVV